MKLKEQKIGKLQWALLLRTILPMLLLAVLIAMVAMLYSQKALRDEIDRSLSTVATSVEAAYDAMYPGDYELVRDEIFASLYKGDRELTGDFSIIDKIGRENGMEITLFYQDARILTTLVDEKGLRLVGSAVNAAIYGKVSRYDKTMYFEPEIDGKRYYTCYRPLHNSDGTQIGMVATALTSGAVQNEMWESIYPVWVITILGLLGASFISLHYTSKVTDSIGKIRDFLTKMVGGSLENELDEEVIKRRDELGEAAGALVKMQKAVRVLVECDPLTTLYNRRYGNAKLKHLVSRSERTGEPFSVAIGDIDFFKKVNDTYGHDAGDEILKFVANELKMLMSGRGSAVRWGGEEFLLMFENHTLGMAAEAIEEFLEIIRNSSIVYDRQVIRITMSVGLAPGETGTDINELVRQADEKLYYAKEHGRDQLVVDRSLIKGDVVQRAENGNEVVLGFSEELLESADILELLAENMAKQAEAEGADSVPEKEQETAGEDAVPEKEQETAGENTDAEAGSSAGEDAVPEEGSSAEGNTDPDEDEPADDRAEADDDTSADGSAVMEAEFSSEAEASAEESAAPDESMPAGDNDPTEEEGVLTEENKPGEENEAKEEITPAEEMVPAEASAVSAENAAMEDGALTEDGVPTENIAPSDDMASSEERVPMEDRVPSEDGAQPEDDAQTDGSAAEEDHAGKDGDIPAEDVKGKEDGSEQ